MPTATKLTRIMTPLIKFRACRDARKVTGDAMEVRGGCGYIEEWSDARLLRDAHLGSIWEGTSNIVALDVLRAIARDDCLPALESARQRAARGMRRSTRRPTRCSKSTLAKVCEFAGDAAAEKDRGARTAGGIGALSRHERDRPRA